MPAKVTVCVPFRGGDPTRERLWVFLRERWQRAGFDVYTGDSGALVFAAAGSRNDAARRGGDWDAAVFVDADVMLADMGQAVEAAKVALETGKYVAAYTTFSWLGEQITGEVVDALREPSVSDTEDVGVGCFLNAFAVRRDLWDELDGFDAETFVGIGGEDVNFFGRASFIAGHTRVPGEAFHLYHTPRAARFTS